MISSRFLFEALYCQRLSQALLPCKTCYPFGLSMRQTKAAVSRVLLHATPKNLKCYLLLSIVPMMWCCTRLLRCVAFVWVRSHGPLCSQSGMWVFFLCSFFWMIWLTTNNWVSLFCTFVELRGLSFCCQLWLNLSFYSHQNVWTVVSLVYMRRLSSEVLWRKMMPSVHPAWFILQNC